MRIPHFAKSLYDKFIRIGLRLFSKLLGDTSNEQENKLSDIKLYNDLFSSIEHEIHSPLAVINNILLSSKGRFSSNSEFLKTLESIEFETTRIKDLVNLVQISRIQKEQVEENKMRILVEDSIKRSIKYVKTYINSAHNIHFNVESKSKRLIVEGIESLLQQAFRNVFSLLIEDKRKKIIEIIIIISIDESKQNVLIEVSNLYRKVKDDSSIRESSNFSFVARKPQIQLFIAEKIIKIHGGKMMMKTHKDKIEGVSISFPRYVT